MTALSWKSVVSTEKKEIIIIRNDHGKKKRMHEKYKRKWKNKIINRKFIYLIAGKIEMFAFSSSSSASSSFCFLVLPFLTWRTMPATVVQLHFQIDVFPAVQETVRQSQSRALLTPFRFFSSSSSSSGSCSLLPIPQQEFRSIVCLDTQLLEQIRRARHQPDTVRCSRETPTHDLSTTDEPSILCIHWKESQFPDPAVRVWVFRG